MEPSKDRNGKIVQVGDRVRLICLSGEWLNDLPADEKRDVLSMVGEIFRVEEIDEYGHPLICKTWANNEEGSSYSHSIALDPEEMQLVNEITP